MSVLMWGDEPDTRGRISGTSRHTKRMPRLKEIAMQQYRRVFAIGRGKDGGQELTVRCAWCGEWLDSVYGKATAEEVSHGLCRPCKDEHFPEPAA